RQGVGRRCRLGGGRPVRAVRPLRRGRTGWAVPLRVGHRAVRQRTPARLAERLASAHAEALREACVRASDGAGLGRLEAAREAARAVGLACRAAKVVWDAHEERLSDWRRLNEQGPEQSFGAFLLPNLHPDAPAIVATLWTFSLCHRAGQI